LEQAAVGFEAWDRDVQRCVDALRAALEAVESGTPQELPARLAQARDRWRALSGELSRVRVEEDLS
jgi:hypothetical protein